MTWLLLISSSLIALLGAALLTLARLEPGHRHISDWGWSHVWLAGGLVLGVVLPPQEAQSLRYAAQAAAATACVVASLAYQLAGASRYRNRPWRWRRQALRFVALLLLVLGLALLEQRLAVVAAALALTGGAWLAGAWLWQGGSRAERFVAGCFFAAGAVHLSGPLLDPLARSVATHVVGTYVQGTLAMALILLSVRHAHGEALRMSERFRLLSEQSMQGLAVLREGQVLYANPAALAMFGFGGFDPTGVDNPVHRWMSEAELARSRERYRRVTDGKLARVEWGGVRKRRDGSEIHLRGISSYIEWNGGAAELVLLLDDTERQRALDDLRRQALHDELTDLPNRHAALARLAELSAPGAGGFVLLSADLDRFQLINESLGHEVGDALLRAIAARLRAALPPGAMLARQGEDQFLWLQPGVADDAGAEQAGQRLLALMNPPFAIKHRELYVHLSVGVARHPAHGADGPALLRAADAAMHRAKQLAGASAVLFEPAMATRSGQRLDIEQALAGAIDAEEFFLDYQPKFAAGSRALVGLEALVRWQRPGHGRVNPADFIPAAEHTGQIAALGALILRLAARQMQAWVAAHGALPPVAVNVSPLQFETPGFATRLLALLREHGLPPAALEIEITETAAIGHLDSVLPQLQCLRDAGVGVAFDDFGTGQSSLTLLRRLPITTLKLDRSMIDPLPEPAAGAVVRAACVLGRALGLAVVAEGVETEAQATAAEALGCTQLQGYLLARPLGVEAVGRLLSAPSTRPA